MKKFLLIFFFAFTANFLYSQNTFFKWAKQMKGGNGSEGGSSIRVDKMGNVISGGVFSGVTDFDPGTGVYNLISSVDGYSVYISKLNTNGDFIWAKGIQAEGFTQIFITELTLDAADNIYVAGFFTGTADFDPGIGIHSITTRGRADMFILKLNAAGDYLWAKSIGIDFRDVANDFELDSQGNIYITGIFGGSGSIDFDPGPDEYLIRGCWGNGFVLKLNNNGNFIWVKTLIGCDYDEGMEIAVDLAGNIFVAGVFNGKTDFDPGPAVLNLTAKGYPDMFILKLDPSGNLVWVKTIGQISSLCTPTAMVLDVTGNIYLTGSFDLTVDFDPGLGVFNMTASSYDGFILKLDGDGKFVWAKLIAGPLENGSMGIIRDNSGNIYSIGSFAGSVDLDPGPGTFTINCNGFSDIYISKLDNNGNFIWGKAIGGIGVDGVSSFVLDKYDNIYLTGIFYETVDFDPENSIHNLSSIARYDIFVEKLGQCSTSSSSNITITGCSSYTLNNEIFDTSGIFTRVLTNASGCDSIITLNLTINGKFTTVNAAICQGQSYFAAGANQTTTGIYKDTLLNSLGCDSIITTNLIVTANLKPNLGPDRNLCSNGSTSITPGSFNSYLWQDNSTQPSLIVSNSGKYWVTVTDANNCSATDTLTVLAIDTVPKNFLPADQLICYGIGFNITVPGYKNYLWSTGNISNTVAINNPGTYYLSVTDNNNCTGKDTVVLQRNYNCIPVNIPNAFTPNKDGTNDTFKPIITQEVSDYSFTIFNRYGQKIFASNKYGIGWDGTFKGVAQPRNAYIYLLNFKNNNGELMEYKGTVTLIR